MRDENVPRSYNSIDLKAAIFNITKHAKRRESNKPCGLSFSEMMKELKNNDR